jgi:hypothetical protein
VRFWLRTLGMEKTISISICITRRTFLIIDRLGIHVSLMGREAAWTRRFGWVIG